MERLKTCNVSISSGNIKYLIVKICRKDGNETVDNCIHETNNLNENWNIVDVDFNKYEKMAFDPFRYEITNKESDLGNVNQSNVKCNYVTNVQLNQMLSNQYDSHTLLNANISKYRKTFR